MTVDGVAQATCTCFCDACGLMKPAAAKVAQSNGKNAAVTERVSEIAETSSVRTAKTSQEKRADPGETPGRCSGEHACEQDPMAMGGPPPGPPLFYQILLTLIMGLALLLVGLDSTITSTVVPTITDYFNYAGDIGWYTSAYLLSTSASQLYYGRLYTMFSAKRVLMGSLVIFEIGAGIAGGAQSSSMLVIGRAVSGLGRAGICSGVMTVLKEVLPLHMRPMAGMTVGAIETIAVVSAPVFGGVLADKASWRWCFLINVPAGIVVLAVVIFYVPYSPAAKQTQQPTIFHTLLLEFDNIGAILVAGAAVSAVLALQWGGYEYSWTDTRVIALIASAGALFIIFVIWEYFQGENAILPLRYYKSRTVAMGALFSFGLDGCLNLVDSYLAIWFQLIKYATPIKSGLMLLPMILSMLIGVAAAGVGTSYLGYYVPFMIASVIVTPVASGLLTTLKVDSGKGMWIGYQALFGVGCGFGLQAPLMAAQTLENKRGGHGVEIGTAVILFTQTLGGTLTAAVAQNILLNHLIDNIPKIVPRISALDVKHTGLADLARHFTPEEVLLVLPAVNDAITQTFKVALVCVCVAVPAALFMKWKPMKPEGEEDGEKSLDNGSSESIQMQSPPQGHHH